MKARVTVTLKTGILDPQGKAIEGALRSLGVAGVASVRQGKVFDIEIEGSDRAQAEAMLKQAADKLLANTVIENYRVEVVGDRAMRPHVVAAALNCLIGLRRGSPRVRHSGPVKPGSGRAPTKAPETDKWDAQRAGRIEACSNASRLACPDAQAVTFTFMKSPTSTIDPKALEKFATVDLPKSMRAASAARAVLSDNQEEVETLALENRLVERLSVGLQ